MACISQEPQPHQAITQRKAQPSIGWCHRLRLAPIAHHLHHCHPFPFIHQGPSRLFQLLPPDALLCPALLLHLPLQKIPAQRMQSHHLPHLLLRRALQQVGTHQIRQTPRPGAALDQRLVRPSGALHQLPGNGTRQCEGEQPGQGLAVFGEGLPAAQEGLHQSLGGQQFRVLLQKRLGFDGLHVQVHLQLGQGEVRHPLQAPGQ